MQQALGRPVTEDAGDLPPRPQQRDRERQRVSQLT